MWDRSNSPAALRTALCSEISPAYRSGISQPANGVMFAPRLSWTARSGVARGAASDELITWPPCLVRAGAIAAPAWARLAYRARSPRPRGSACPPAAGSCLVMQNGYRFGLFHGPMTFEQISTAAQTCASYAAAAGWANNGNYGGNLV